ncbi:MAG: hypothetical protein DHS20C13_07110 [Thermodesulfobacteriota bacterium]|nr:MAG: hypothetical protein DHS20C13_07110 [Thermodesulfobacteriota bacterium]
MRRQQLVMFLLVCPIFIITNLFVLKSAHAMSCLPTCSSNDARFLAFGGQDIATFVYESMTLGIASPAGSQTIKISIFDGENTGHWDFGAAEQAATLEFTLIADPKGDLSGTLEVGKWLSDGSDGMNIGNPMLDNDWFDIIINNVPDAIAESGNYLYIMRIRNLDTTQSALNNYKIRTDGTIFIFPTDQPLAYEAGLRGLDADFIGLVANIIYPNIDLDDPFCINMGNFCDPNEPGCCLFGTPYDGTFSFFFILENAQDILNFWDGDFDFGMKTPGEGAPFEDTNDPNTPPGLPLFADIPNTNPQASVGALPPDDNSLGAFRRMPNIFYEIISPDGNLYSNLNPSGTNEWELFQINTQSGCEPDICDVQVDSIPAGIWELRIKGLDMSNLNFIRGFEKIIGVDDKGDPVPPLPPDPPNPIPSLSGTGLVLLSILTIIVSIYYLSIRKKKYSCNYFK